MAKNIVTGEDNMNKRFPNENLQPGEEIKTDLPPEANTEEEAGEKAKLDEKMGSYRQHYPTETLFLITSDGQVFLERNKADATAHQQQLDANKSVVTYTM